MFISRLGRGSRHAQLRCRPKIAKLRIVRRVDPDRHG
jgi:hypothetical protein